MSEREPLLVGTPVTSSSASSTYGTTSDEQDSRGLEAGHRVNSSDVLVSPLPWAQVSILWTLYLVYPMVYEIIFPFLNQMLVELDIVQDPSQVGFYSGIIESIFSIASFCTVLPSSYASDYVGRKPVIIIGMIGVALSLTSFGLSRTFPLLIMSRCLSGGLSGVEAAVRIMMGEITDRTNMDTAFNGLSIMYRLGQILGLPVGGLLAHPERHFPSLFGGKFWLHNPFLLPCLFGAAIALVGALLGLIFLPETKRISKADAEEVVQNVDGTEKSPSIMALLADREIRNLFIFNIEYGFGAEMLFSLYALFAFTPVELGGLGFSEAQIGIQLSIRSIIHVFFLLAFNPIFRWFGRTSAVRMHQWCAFLWPLTCVFYPLLSIIARVDGTSGWLFWTTTMAFYIVWSLAGLGWTTIGMIVTDGCPSASALASVNGLFAMSQTLPMAVSPTLSTSLFAATIGVEVGGVQLVWLIIFLILFLSALHSLAELREPVDDWRLKKTPNASDSSLDVVVVT